MIIPSLSTWIGMTIPSLSTGIRMKHPFLQNQDRKGFLKVFLRVKPDRNPEETPFHSDSGGRCDILTYQPWYRHYRDHDNCTLEEG